MSIHKAALSNNKDGSCYALIVRVDQHGEHVIRGYKGRTLASRKAAETSTARYMKKWEL